MFRQRSCCIAKAYPDQAKEKVKVKKIKEQSEKIKEQSEKIKEYFCFRFRLVWVGPKSR